MKLRNEAARSLGFRDFHAMQLAINEPRATGDRRRRSHGPNIGEMSHDETPERKGSGRGDEARYE